MKLEIILQLLYINGYEEVVSRAVQIENGIALRFSEGDVISVDLSKSDLPEGNKFRGDNSHWGVVACLVQAVNPYNLKTPYCIITPKGETKWVNASERATLSEIVNSELSAIAGA